MSIVEQEEPPIMDISEVELTDEEIEYLDRIEEQEQ